MLLLLLLYVVGDARLHRPRLATRVAKKTKNGDKPVAEKPRRYGREPKGSAQHHSHSSKNDIRSGIQAVFALLHSDREFYFTQRVQVNFWCSRGKTVKEQQEYRT
jgi:hypothetical protein